MVKQCGVVGVVGVKAALVSADWLKRGPIRNGECRNVARLGQPHRMGGGTVTKQGHSRIDDHAHGEGEVDPTHRRDASAFAAANCAVDANATERCSDSSIACHRSIDRTSVVPSRACARSLLSSVSRIPP